MGLGSRAIDAGAGFVGLLPLRPGGDDQVNADHHMERDSTAGTRTAMPLAGEITIRVRYAETDRMGLLHHANYLICFEQARTELLRDVGLTYKDMEDAA